MPYIRCDAGARGRIERVERAEDGTSARLIIAAPGLAASIVLSAREVSRLRRELDGIAAAIGRESDRSPRAEKPRR